MKRWKALVLLGTLCLGLLLPWQAVAQEEVKKIIKFEMENAVKLDVPLIAEVSEAKNWYECK